MMMMMMMMMSLPSVRLWHSRSLQLTRICRPIHCRTHLYIQKLTKFLISSHSHNAVSSVISLSHVLSFTLIKLVNSLHIHIGLYTSHLKHKGNKIL